MLTAVLMYPGIQYVLAVVLEMLKLIYTTEKSAIKGVVIAPLWLSDTCS